MVSHLPRSVIIVVHAFTSHVPIYNRLQSESTRKSRQMPITQAAYETNNSFTRSDRLTTRYLSKFYPIVAEMTHYTSNKAKQLFDWRTPQGAFYHSSNDHSSPRPQIQWPLTIVNTSLTTSGTFIRSPVSTSLLRPSHTSTSTKRNTTSYYEFFTPTHYLTLH